MLSNKNTSNNKSLINKSLNENKTKFISKRKKGFSLLEIVVSLGLIAILIIPIGNMVLGTVKINRATEDKQQASAVLQETVEYIKLMDELPKLGAEAKDLGNGVMLKAEEVYEYETEDRVKKNGIRYSVKSSSDTEYGFSVNGEMLGREVIEEKEITGENGIDLNTQVDGVIRYENKNKNYNKLLVSGEKSTIKQGIERSSYIEWAFSNEVDIDFEDFNKNPSIVEIETKKNEIYLSPIIHKAILIIIDTEIIEPKLTVELEEADIPDGFEIYIYNKNSKADKNDIIIKYEDCNATTSNVTIKPTVSFTDSIIVKGINMYSLNINAEKHGKEIDKLNLEIIK